MRHVDDNHDMDWVLLKFLGWVMLTGKRLDGFEQVKRQVHEL